MPDELPQVFDRTIADGERRLDRSWPQLLATGAVGGIDVSIGVFALLSVRSKTGSEVLAALFFGIGFIALTLANSELFTENFLVPIAALAANRSRWHRLLRLWGGALVMNLIGGWVTMAIVIGSSPGLRHTAVEVGSVYPRLGTGWTSFASAVLGGAVITLMTWMERSTESVPARLIAALAAAFLLAIGPLEHTIVASLEMFSALQAGAPFGYADWLRVVAWACLGNLVGGIGLVTVLRLVQVGRATIEDRQEQAAVSTTKPSRG